MSINLLLLRIEVVEDYPIPKSLEYCGSKYTEAPKDNPEFDSVPHSNFNLKVRRGLREPKKITVISLDEKAIAEEMKAFDISSINYVGDNSTSNDEEKKKKEQELEIMLTKLNQDSEIQSKVLNQKNNNSLTKAAIKKKSLKQDTKMANDNLKTVISNKKKSSEICTIEQKESVLKDAILATEDNKYTKKILGKAQQALEEMKTSSEKVDGLTEKAKSHDTTGTEKTPDIPVKEKLSGRPVKGISQYNKKNEKNINPAVYEKEKNPKVKGKSTDFTIKDKPKITIPEVEARNLNMRGKLQKHKMKLIEKEKKVNEKDRSSTIDAIPKNLVGGKKTSNQIEEEMASDLSLKIKPQVPTKVEKHKDAPINIRPRDPAVDVKHKDPPINIRPIDPAVDVKHKDPTAVNEKIEESILKDTIKTPETNLMEIINTEDMKVSNSSGFNPEVVSESHQDSSDNRKVNLSSVKDTVKTKVIDNAEASKFKTPVMYVKTEENVPTDNSTFSSDVVNDSSPMPLGCKEGTPTTVLESHAFESGNSLVEVTKGILHFYKENSKTSLAEEVERSEMLCMLAVPTSMGVHELLQFIAACYTSIQHLRIIRDSSLNQYLVLLKFRSQMETDFFYTSYNGQQFNNIQSDICNLVYVSRVEMTDEAESNLQIPGHTELPTCPVCLERMDESVDGIITILCNHSFHGQCLGKWGDSSCPVCRYCQVPDELPEQRCVTCAANDSLWICLICANVGCGRYLGGHAYNHFTDTNHLFALQIGTNRVWDYVKDNYVHRLLQSEGDGKMVSFERESNSDDCKQLNAHGQEKLSAIQLEYTHLLTIQMDSQREYFESILTQKKVDANKEIEAIKREEEKLKAELKRSKDSLDKLGKEKKNMESKLRNNNEKLSKLTKDLNAEKVMAKAVLQNNLKLACDIQELEINRTKDLAEIEELRSQATDFMKHLSAKNTIDENPELLEGSVSAPPPVKKNRRGRRHY